MQLYRNFLCFIFLLFSSGVLAMEISMPNFTAGGILPAKYTVDGAGVSPELNWRDVPKDCKSLVLICEDPDAPLGLWTHWIVYNLPPNATGLVEGVRDLPAGAQFGLNTIQEPSYCPPAPPKGEHRYYFKLYALDVVLDLKKPTRDELMKAMKGHIVVQASLLTKYQRPF